MIAQGFKQSYSDPKRAKVGFASDVEIPSFGLDISDSFEGHREIANRPGLGALGTRQLDPKREGFSKGEDGLVEIAEAMLELSQPFVRDRQIPEHARLVSE